MLSLVLVAVATALFSDISITTTHAQIFQPTSQYTDTFTFNGQQQTRNVLTVHCSESSPRGQLVAGAIVVNVTCIPPRALYDLVEVGRIPRHQELHQEQICLVDNLQQYASSQQYDPSSPSSPSSPTPTSRRLLGYMDDVQYSDFSTFIPILGPLDQAGKVRRAQQDATNALAGVNTLNERMRDQQTALSTLNAWQGQVTNDLDGFSTLQRISQTQIQGLVSDAARQRDIAANQKLLLDQLANDASRQDAALQSNIDNVNRQLAATSAATASAINSTTQALLGALRTLNDASSNNFNYLSDATTQLSRGNIDLTSVVFDKFRRTQQRKLGQLSFFDSLSQLQSSLVPLLFDGGMRPNPDANRVGTPQKRILFELFDVNWVSAITGGSYQVVNTQLRVYFGTDYATRFARPWSTLDTILSSMGPSRCNRPYVNDDASASTATTTENLFPGAMDCQMWTEVVQSSCTRTASASIFSWRTGDPTRNATSQPSVLSNTNCNNAIVQTSPVLVLRSLTDFIQYSNTRMCNASMMSTDTNYMIRARRFGTVSYVPRNLTACGYNYRSMLYQGSLSANPLLPVVLFTGIESIFPQVRNDVYAYSLLFNGRLPAGLTSDIDYFVYTPIQLQQFAANRNVTSTSTQYVDAQGNVVPLQQPVLDGSADPNECINLYWAAVSPDTLPVYSIRPFTDGAYVSKEVDVTVATSNTDPNSFTVSPTSDVQLSSDTAWPGVMISVGGISQPDALYDVPDGSAPVSGNLFERSRRVTYYLMPPQTYRTETLEQFSARNPVGYDARDASVSASQYRVRVQRDYQNYPVCSVPGGVPPPMLMNGGGGVANTRQCANTFQWSNVASGIPTIVIPQCNYALTARTLYKNAAAEQASLTLSSLPVSQVGNMFCGGRAFSLSAWVRIPSTQSTGVATYLLFGFRFQSDINYITTVRFILTAGVPSFQIQRVSVNPSLQSVTLTPNVPSTALLDDGMQHHVSFEYTGSSTPPASFNAVANVMRVRLDGIDIGSLTGIAFGSPFTSGPTAFLEPVMLSGDANLLLYFADRIWTELDLQQHATCELSWIAPRCAATTAEQTVISAENVATTHGVDCLPFGMVLYVSETIQQIYAQQAVARLPPTAFAASWSVGFWIHAGATGACLAPTTPLLQMGNALSVQYVCSSTDATQLFRLRLTIWSTTVAITQSMLADGQFHHIVLAYTSTGNAALYVDTFLDSTWSATRLAYSPSGNPANNGLSVFVSTYTHVVKYYDNTALRAVQVSNERQCQVDAVMPVRAFASPVGTCTYISDGSSTGMQRGYCRHRSMCNGHCAAYSFIDVAHGIFFASTYMCDTGYAPPDCLQLCKRVDAASGECLDLSPGTAYAQGLTPGSSWCQTLATHKASAYNITVSSTGESRQILSLEKRAWVYEAVIYVPTGNYVNVLGESACPTVSIVPLSGSGTSVQLQNTLNVQTQVRVAFFSAVALLAAGNACQLPCCNLPGQMITLPAHTLMTVPIGACGNMTISVQRLLNAGDQTYASCTELSSDVVAQQSTTALTSIPLAYERRVTLAVDQLGVDFYQLNMQTQQQQLRLLLLGATNDVTKQQYELILSNIYQQVLKDTARIVSLGTGANLTAIAPIVLNQTLVDAIDASIRDITKNLAEQNKLAATYDNQFYSLENQLNLTRQLSANFSRQLLAWFEEINQELPQPARSSGDNPLGFLGGLFNTVSDLQSKVGDGISGILGLPANMFSSISGFISGIVKLLPVILIGGAVVLGVIFVGPPVLSGTLSLARVAGGGVKSALRSSGGGNGSNKKPTASDTEQPDDESEPLSPSHTLAVSDDLDIPIPLRGGKARMATLASSSQRNKRM